MALTIFLFKVSNLEIVKSKSDPLFADQGALAETINEEQIFLVCAKASFRGINLWSNNVRIQNGTASFIARGNKPKKFQFNLGTMLLSTDKLRLEFYTVTTKKNRKKLIAVFDLMLESLMDLKHIDLQEENLSDPNNYLMKSTVQLKLYYTPPSTDREKAALSTTGDEIETVDWNVAFDDEARHGGHRYRHVRSKNDGTFTKLRRKLVSRQDDADTDSCSDTKFELLENTDEALKPMTEKEKLKRKHNNLELLEKSLGRYEGDVCQIQEWQIMVHVIQGRDFVGLEINPYVCIQIDDQKRYTGVQRSTNAPFFGEFFTFDFTLPVTQMMEKVIYFKVHHDRKFVSAFTHTKPIGIFKVDVATVYNEREHAFERKWAQLIDPDAIQVVFGHLLLSVAVTERGVPSKNILGEVTQEDDELKPLKTFIPSAMPRTLFPVQLKLTFFSATELPEMMSDFLATVSKKILHSDAWEAVDPYIEVTYNAVQATTDHRNGASPVWGESLYLIGQFPPLVRTMKISLKDRSAVQPDRTIASLLIDLFSISESNPSAGFLPTFGPTWIFLYGSPREYTTNKDQDGLGQGMGEGVCYKGRLLMQIDCYPISGDKTSNTNVQKETGIQFPEVSKFPPKRTFLLFGCLFDVTMIDKEFGNTTIYFELSIGSSGYMNPTQLINHQIASSITRPYPRIPIDNNKQHFRLPIDLQKPILFTKYTFYDYSYRMMLTNRLKHASDHMFKLIREFELNLNSKTSDDILMQLYRKIELYLQTLPCGCALSKSNEENLGLTAIVHPNLSDSLTAPKFNIRMNALDEKRRKKIVHNLETLKGWLTSDIQFDETTRTEIVKQLYKIARALKQLAVDVQPSLPDIFLWMICDEKRVAYVRIPPEDLLYSICEGEKGLHNGRVQTLFLRTPNTSDKPIKSSTNAKVQIYLWLGTEEQQATIFKELPPGYDMPPLPLSVDSHYIRYNGKSYYELRCHCCKARSLIASDETGLSDPFLSITAGNETQTTPILKESLCPQWSMTLVFKNLMHVGNRDVAEEIIGNVVVECYDYDEGDDGSDFIGRFSTTAKLDLFTEDQMPDRTLLRWYEFKFGEKRAGELLALFELIEVDPETRIAQSIYELDQITLTADLFPPENYVITFTKNPVYQLPDVILPTTKLYEIEVIFWGLRECRSINLQPIQQAEVSIECAGARITKAIKNVQKNPNFDSSSTDADKYKLLVSLPEDKDFWPHISIYCVQNRLFGMKEAVGNLVITDIQKYLQKSNDPSAHGEALANAVNELSRTVPYNFHRVRRSVIDAYDAAVARKDQDGAKKKLKLFENNAEEKSINESEKHLVTNDVENKENFLDVIMNLTDSNDTSLLTDRVLTNSERLKQKEMEKTANWWTKYYASKAKYKLEQKSKLDLDETFEDVHDAYAQLFAEDSNVLIRQQQPIWNKAKKIFSRVGKAEKQIKSKVRQKFDEREERKKHKSAIDESLDLIEADRLTELTLLQTFDIVQTELEHLPEYEGFSDCFDKFPLYKGKGTSRSDEIGDEHRVYAKFKGKFRIRELSMENTRHNTSATTSTGAQTSFNSTLLKSQLELTTTQGVSSVIERNEEIHHFDLNRNPITFKCRLYIIKALLFRSKDQSGKADPFIKILLNNDVIINDVKSKIHNTLEPVFGKSYEFEVTIPYRSLLRIQIWDWDLANSNDLIAETTIDIENRWLSSHRATCGLAKRYDSAGYNAWRDTKTPTTILNALCQTINLNLPVYTADFTALAIGDIRFHCDPECVQFVQNKTPNDLLYRKAHHESAEEYLRQNTALAALHGWGEKIDPNGALVSEHIECRSVFDPESPDVEQGKLEMWLDFFPMSRPPSSAPVDITPPKPLSYQLRLIIWNTSDVELDDENFVTGEKSSDIYVKAWILGENEDAQQTDVHYRSLTGEGNFNWRFVFDFNYLEIEEKIVYERKESIFQIGNTVKKIPPRIVLRVYDADLISADDFLGQCILDLTHLPIGAKAATKCKADMLMSSKQKSVNLFKTKRAAGWWPMLAPLKAGEIRDISLLGGKVEAEFSLVSAEDAEKTPVGKAREGPSPLEEPNRPKTSFLWFTSPWKTFRFVIWRNFKWPIIIGVIIVIFVVFLLLALWTVPGEIIRQISNKIAKTNGAGK